MSYNPTKDGELVMATKKKTSKRRTQVKDLPKRKKEMTKGEQKKVKGGANTLLNQIATGQHHLDASTTADFTPTRK